ncbi:hypothetical protein GCM10027419_30090 [Pandoraea terrae]
MAHARSADLGATVATKGTAQGAPACIGCHGAKGEGNAAAGFPRLSGLSAEYLATQLDDFTSGQRSNPVMRPIAKNMSSDSRKAVAVYFGALLSRAGIKAADPGNAVPSDAGAWLPTRGRWESGLPARSVMARVARV